MASLNGSQRWLIDVRRFAGTPVLTVTPRLPRGKTVELKGALLPPSLFETPMTLSFTLAGFSAQGSSNAGSPARNRSSRQ